jgi:hypothetical protein
MKPRQTIDESSRFRGSVRHYHRAANPEGKNWDAWVNGKAGIGGKSRNWPKIFITVIASLALLGVIVGLFIELG